MKHQRFILRHVDGRQLAEAATRQEAKCLAASLPGAALIESAATASESASSERRASGEPLLKALELLLKQDPAKLDEDFVKEVKARYRAKYSGRKAAKAASARRAA